MINLGKITRQELSNGLKAELDKTNEVKQQLDEHKAEYAIQTAGGTTNAIVVSTGGDFKYTQGNKISFKAIANSTSAVTVNIDNKGAKALKKLDGTNATVKANKVYEIFYSVADNCFFLLARAEGNVIAEEVLASKIFSNDDDTGLVGTMPNIGKQTGTITTLGGKIFIGKGYHDGTGFIEYFDPNHIASNIRKGAKVGGVDGAYEMLVGVGDIALTSRSIMSGVNSTSYTKKFGYIVGISGNYRVKIWATSSTVTGYIRVYVNGVAKGTEFVVNGSSVSTTQDISGVKAGDEIQIYMRISNSSYSIRLDAVTLYTNTNIATAIEY